MALHEGSQSRRNDIVSDTYRETSIKNTERSLRGEVQGIQVANVTASQLVKQWRIFLSQLENKTTIVRFLVHEWSTQQYRDRLQCQGKLQYITFDEKYYKITGEGTEDVPELANSHEDRRLTLASSFMLLMLRRQVITEDTDVFILPVAFLSMIGVKLFHRCGSQTRTRLFDSDRVPLLQLLEKVSARH